MFVDDLKIYKVVESSDVSLLQTDLDSFCYWCAENNLSLNIKKCFCITFSRTVCHLAANYSIDSELVYRVKEMRDLGIY